MVHNPPKNMQRMCHQMEHFVFMWNTFALHVLHDYLVILGVLLRSSGEDILLYALMESTEVLPGCSGDC